LDASEKVLDAGIEQVFSKAHGRIIVATFASLISGYSKSPMLPPNTTVSWLCWQ